MTGRTEIYPQDLVAQLQEEGRIYPFVHSSLRQTFGSQEAIDEIDLVDLDPGSDLDMVMIYTGGSSSASDSDRRIAKAYLMGMASKLEVLSGRLASGLVEDSDRQPADYEMLALSLSSPEVSLEDREEIAWTMAAGIVSARGYLYAFHTSEKEFLNIVGFYQERLLDYSRKVGI